MKVIFHVDLDAFYAAVEQLEQPSLRGKPVIVGAAPGRRGVVSSCSYEARQFGIRSAMPISEACRRCPLGVYLPVRMQRYLEYSERVMQILASFTPQLRQISIDEASLDLSGTERLFGPPAEAARRLKERVRTGTGLTISVGVAPNRYLAKLASEFGKPDGLTVIGPGEEASFLERLELRQLWGVGRKTLERLEELNVRTVRRLRELSEPMLRSMMGEAAGSYLFRVARGEDPGIYADQPRSHSMSSETTFETDVTDREVLARALLELSQQVAQRMIRSAAQSNTAFLKLRLFDFTTTSARRTVGRPIASSDDLHRLAMELLNGRWDGRTPVRLVGVGVANVSEGRPAVQGELFQDGAERRRLVEEAAARIRERGGKLTRASLLRPPRPPGSRGEDG